MTRRFIPALVLTLGTALLALAIVHHPAPEAGAQPLNGSERLSARLDAIVSAAHARGNFNGSVLVTRAGTVLLSKGYGTAATGKTYTAATAFTLPDSAAHFDTIALLRLAQQGLLWLNAPSCRYVSTCPAAWHALSVRNLMTAADTGKVAASGLPALIGFASGESYAQYLGRSLFQPLGMTATTVDSTTPAGDIRTDAADLNRWLDAMEGCSAVVSLQETENAGLAHAASMANGGVDVAFGPKSAARLLPGSSSTIVVIADRAASVAPLINALTGAILG